MFGEVHTELLRNSASVSNASAKRILSFRLGDDIRTSTRPTSYAVSSDLYDGLDCRVGGATRQRGVGTAVSFASITGGQIAQAVTMTSISHGKNNRRMPWSYYLSRPGQVETMGNEPVWAQIADGWATADKVGPNLGAISDRLLDTVQMSPQLSGAAAVRRTGRARLRWVYTGTAQPLRLSFSLESDDLRLLRLSGGNLSPRAAADFCADLALHDWLLTALMEAIERSRLESDDGTAAVQKLRPVIVHLLHHWMPAARLDAEGKELWCGLDEAAGLSRQWESLVARVRDQLAIGLLGAVAQPDRA
ncbi:SCO2521 family protein [Cryptosporangium sp. NPDC048952]|uniref:SCO2521 family protein n=1 Tax=Cryptosporangium sp. NPDC048952 TaxID=3363961 RepID=UPI00371EA1F3